MMSTLRTAVQKLITEESGMVRTEHAILLSMLALSTLTAIANVTRVSGVASWSPR